LEVNVDGMTLRAVEQLGEEAPEEQLVDLSLAELDQVGGGVCDPGIIIIEK
jgi:hypothetical protein